jgi:hypothetical protein
MATVTNKIVNGAYVLYDSDYKFRYLDAWGENVVKKILDVGHAPVSSLPAEFVLTLTGTTPTVVNSATAGSIFDITNTTAEYSGVNMQLLGTAFGFTASKPFYFGIKVKIGGAGTPATDCDILLGLSLLKTAVTNASSSHAIAGSGNEGAFIFKASGSTTGTVYSYVNGTQTNSVAYGTALTATAFVFELYWSGSALNAYVDNNLVGTFTGSLPTVALTPTICYRSGAGGVADTLRVDWMRCIQMN